MDTSARVACCLICTLSATMRDCQSCAFNIGLPYRQDAITSPIGPAIKADDKNSEFLRKINQEE